MAPLTQAQHLLCRGGASCFEGLRFQQERKTLDGKAGAEMESFRQQAQRARASWVPLRWLFFCLCLARYRNVRCASIVFEAHGWSSKRTHYRRHLATALTAVQTWGRARDQASSVRCVRDLGKEKGR